MAELGRDEAIGGLTLRRREGQRRAAGEEGSNLLQCLEPLGLERHDHPPMIPAPRRPSGSLYVGITRPFRLMCHWKRLLVDESPEMQHSWVVGIQSTAVQRCKEGSGLATRAFCISGVLLPSMQILWSHLHDGLAKPAAIPPTHPASRRQRPEPSQMFAILRILEIP